MEAYERERIEALIGSDPELDRLWQQHLELETRLEELEAIRHLSPGEELERKRLQKTKLSGMDRIAEIVAGHRAS
jgi:uncharacterized protein YdcH (DUF465 family)